MRRSISASRIVITIIAAMLTVILTPPASYQLVRGSLYKSLAHSRPAVDADPDIVLIEVKPEAAYGTSSVFFWTDFFLVLHEMDAKQVLLTPRDEARESSGFLSSDQKEHIQNRFDVEFGLINNNIATLFDAIRYGSVHPKDAARFVENLLSLTDKGKERLLDDTISSDARGTPLLQKARRVFGEENLGTTLEDLGYSLPSYKAAFAFADYPREHEDTIPFRRLPIELINTYIQLDEELYGFLTAMEEAGYFSYTPPEKYPTILYDHVQTLLLELLDTPREKAKSAWLDSKARYEQSVIALLTGNAQSMLEKGVATLLTEERQDEDQVKRIQELRQGLAEAFSETRRVADELIAVKNLLSRELNGATCIVGMAPDPLREHKNVWSAPTAAETAAAQIQSIRSGRHSIIPTGWRHKFVFAIPGLLFAALLSILSLPFVFLTGFLAMFAIGAAFSVIYIATGIFVHPIYAALVPAAAGTTTLLVAWLLRFSYVRKVSPATGNRFPRPYKWVFRATEKPPAASLYSKFSVILAVRCRSDINWSEDNHGKRRAALLNEFHSVAGKVIKRRGGFIVGSDGLIIFAGFGTPFDRIASRVQSHLSIHVNNALLAASDLSGKASSSCRSWSFGMDAGECTFYFSSINGFSIEGSPAVYARVLSGLAARYKHHILVTADIMREAGDGWASKRLDNLVEKVSGGEKAFHALMSRKQA